MYSFFLLFWYFAFPKIKAGECQSNLNEAIDVLSNKDFIEDVTKHCMAESVKDFEHAIADVGDEQLMIHEKHEAKGRSVF